MEKIKDISANNYFINNYIAKKNNFIFNIKYNIFFMIFDKYIF